METFEPNINYGNSEASRESNHKKRRKIADNTGDQNSLNLMPWRSETEQQIYSRKLVDALRRIPSPPAPATAKPRPAGQVRHTADRVLAATAKGRTRWSRAILRRSMKLKRNHKKAKKPATGLKRTGIERERIRRLPPVQKKARVLGRLVPGCRKVPFPNLLEEATDYISALEMQVRAMTALAELLSGVAPAGLSGLS